MLEAVLRSVGAAFDVADGIEAALIGLLSGHAFRRVELVVLAVVGVAEQQEQRGDDGEDDVSLFAVFAVPFRVTDRHCLTPLRAGLRRACAAGIPAACARPTASYSVNACLASALASQPTEASQVTFPTSVVAHTLADDDAHTHIEQ